MTIDIADLLDEQTSALAESDAALEAFDTETELAELLAHVENDAARPGLMVYDLETIPDESRFPAPESATPPGMKIPTDKLLELSIADLKLRLDAATDAELVLLMEAEAGTAKPRKGVIDAITSLRTDRETSFDKWVKQHSVDPFACRICCFGWSVGDGQVRAMVAKDDGEERMILESFWKLMGKDRIRVGFGITRFDDAVILNRSVALGVPVPRRLDVRKYNNREAHDLENIIFANSQTQKCKTVARAWGIRIPVPDVDGSKVYELFKAGEFQKIAAYCCSDVEVEREMFRIASRLYA